MWCLVKCAVNWLIFLRNILQTGNRAQTNSNSQSLVLPAWGRWNVWKHCYCNSVPYPAYRLFIACSPGIPLRDQYGIVYNREHIKSEILLTKYSAEWLNKPLALNITIKDYSEGSTLILSKWVMVVESMTAWLAGHFGLVGLCQLRTKLFIDYW